MNTISGITVSVCALLVIVAVTDARISVFARKCAGLNCTECITGEDMSVPKACCYICKKFGRCVFVFITALLIKPSNILIYGLS